MAKTYMVVSQNIIDRQPNGARFTHGAVQKSNPIIWGQHTDNRSVLKRVIIHMYNQLVGKHIGGVIYLQVYKDNKPINDFIKVYQGKLGHDDRLFIRYEGGIKSWARKQTGLPRETNN